MIKVLLLWSNGQLWSSIKEILWKSHNISLYSYLRKDYDIEKDDMDTIFNDLDVDYIINTIAYHDLQLCEDNKEVAFSINSDFVKNLSIYSKKNNICLIHFSTDYVFNWYNNIPYSENDKCKPLNIYGESKLLWEKFIKENIDKYFIFRVSSLFWEAWPSWKDWNFIDKIISLWKKNKELSIVSDQFMSPTYTIDIAHLIENIIIDNFTKYWLYNFSNLWECSWYEYAIEVFKYIWNKKVIVKGVKLENYNWNINKPKYTILDKEKIWKYYKIRNYNHALIEYLYNKEYINEMNYISLMRRD